MTNLEKQVSDITIGIRFQRSFKIQDILGTITDKLLHDENSPLSVDYFPRRDQNLSEMILTNDKESYLKVNTDDIIFRHSIEKDLHNDIEFMKEYLKYIRKLLRKYNIQNITRIGIIYNHKFKGDQSKFDDAIKSITNNTLVETDNFSFSFSKKIPDPTALYDTDVDDYRNVIYIFKKISDKIFSASVDYQKYFKPPLEYIEDELYENLLNDSRHFLEKKFYNIFLDIDE